MALCLHISISLKLWWWMIMWYVGIRFVSWVWHVTWDPVVWSTRFQIQMQKNVRHAGMIIFVLSERGGTWGATAQRWERAEEEVEEEEGKRRGKRGEWRRKRRARKPQITSINHWAVNIFTSRWPVIGSCLGSVCVFCILCVCLRCLAHPELHSLSHCLRLSLNWRHKQLRNRPRQQEAGRCVNSPSTKLGCARLQKRLRSHITVFNHKHFHGSGWKHTLDFSQGFALDAGQGFG